MMTSLVDLEDARGRLEDGEQPYAFQVGEHFTMLGPACRFGSDYLRTLRTEGRYAESFEEATQVADARGATITGIWFVKRSIDDRNAEAGVERTSIGNSSPDE